MSVKDLANESFHVRRKGDQNLLGPYPGTYDVTKGQVLLFDAPPNVARQGDELLRQLSGSDPEILIIREIGLQKGLDEIPDYHIIETKKGKSASPAVNIGSVHGGVQVGDHNTQNFITVFEDLIQRIDNSDASDPEKMEARSLLANFLQHPIIAAIGGAAAAALLAKLGQS